MHTDGLTDSFQTLWEKSVDFYCKFRFLRSLWYVPLKVDHHYPHDATFWGLVMVPCLKKHTQISLKWLVICHNYVYIYITNLTNYIPFYPNSQSHENRGQLEFLVNDRRKKKKPSIPIFMWSTKPPILPGMDVNNHPQMIRLYYC